MGELELRLEGGLRRALESEDDLELELEQGRERE